VSEKSDHSPDLYPGHYLHRGPSVVIGIVSVLVALVLLAFAISELRKSAQGRATLATVTESETTSEVPVLRVAENEWKLNNSEISESDLAFRLSALSSSAQGIVIEYPDNLPADLITRALNSVNQAGFSQVGMRLLDGTTTGSITVSP